MGWPAHMQRPAKGAGKGDGWGGPAKGEGATRIRPGDPDGIQAMSNDPEVRARRAKQAEELHERLYALATEAERQETQLAATIAFLDRTEGKPVSRVDNRVSGGEGGPINFTWMPVTD